jgi:hypothetical protein
MFDRAAARTLWYAVGAFALAFLLSFALPHDYDETNRSQPPSRPDASSIQIGPNGPRRTSG